MTAGRARALVEAYHRGRISRRQLAEGLWRLYAEEVAGPLAPDRAGPADGTPEAGEADGAAPGLPRRAASGLWILLTADACHFCGRRDLPVVALKAGEDDPGWVHLCLDDLERIRGEARAFLGGGEDVSA